MIARTWAMADATLRELGRRRVVLALMLALPMMFYLGRRGDHTGQAIRFLLLGVGFTVTTGSLFATAAARSLEPRLRLSGYRVRELYLGRLLALLGLGLGLAAPYFLVILADQQVERVGALGLALVGTVVVSAPLGMLLGALIPGDMEGVLLLIAVMSLTWLIDPAKPAARALPWWSTREVATYAVDMADAGYLQRGLAHAAGYGTALLLLTTVIAWRRLRLRYPEQGLPPAVQPA